MSYLPPSTRSARIPADAWTLPFSTADPKIQVSRPGILDTIKLLPLARRVGSYVYREHRAGRTPIFDLNGITLDPPVPRSNAGVPIGGIGGGAIGRGIRGEFRRWSLTPGRYRHSIVQTNNFSVKIGDKSTVLSSEKLSDVPAPLRSWTWGSSPEVDLSSRSTYHALFPRSWTVYSDPTNNDTGVEIIAKQVSPFIPDNYSDSSLPCCVFEFSIINNSGKDQEVSIMQTWENNDGGDEKDEAEHRRNDFSSSSRRHSSLFEAVDDGQNNKKNETKSAGGGFFSGSKGPRDVNAATTALVDGVGISMRHTRRRKIAYEKGPDERMSIPTNDPLCSCPGACSPLKLASTYEEKVNFSLAVPKSTDAVDVTTCVGFDPSDAYKCEQLWASFSSEGCLEKKSSDVPGSVKSTNGLQANAVCQKTTVKAGCTSTLVFALAWDSPLAMFGSGEGLPRRHSVFFPPPSSPSAASTNAPALALIALTKYKAWEKAIEDWQNPVLTSSEYPGWFKNQLFNELYYLTDGGCVWVDSSKAVKNDRGNGEVRGVGGVGGVAATMDRGEGMEAGIRPVAFAAMKKMEELNAEAQGAQGDLSKIGEFLYLEGHEYIMYNTSDVHFYASFALAKLFPQLQLSVLRDYAHSVFMEDAEERKLLGEGERALRKVNGALVHDLGSPSEAPILKVNAYNFQDVSRWKDLPSKFVLMIVREVSDETKDMSSFLSAVWPAMQSCMDRAAKLWDVEGSGMIKNEGFPDQTYDVWIADGVSAYTGGLWVAALFGMSKIAARMGDMEKSLLYSDKAKKAKTIWNDILWNGKYFNYSEKGRYNSGSIMADQLCGQWWTRVCDLPSVCDDDEKARKSLKSIYDANVMQWKEISGGVLNGAVNGMKTDGTVDGSCLQSMEVWTGTTYGLASEFLHEANMVEDSGNDGGSAAATKKMLREAGFETARGIREAGWDRFGYSFATPEAWDGTGAYRSLGYMRPLCIWSMLLEK